MPRSPRCQPTRPAQFDGAGDLPPLPGRRPLVYVSFGTAAFFATPERLRMIAHAVGSLGAGAVITGAEPSELGVLPDGIAAHRFVPQSRLLLRRGAAVALPDDAGEPAVAEGILTWLRDWQAQGAARR